MSFLRKKDDFVDLLLRHIGTSAIMDLLLRLLTCVERPQLRQDVFNVRSLLRKWSVEWDGLAFGLGTYCFLLSVAQRREDCPAAN